MPITNPAPIMYTNMAKAADAMNEQRQPTPKNKGLLKIYSSPEEGSDFVEVDEKKVEVLGEEDDFYHLKKIPTTITILVHKAS